MEDLLPSAQKPAEAQAKKAPKQRVATKAKEFSGTQVRTPRGPLDHMDRPRAETRMGAQLDQRRRSRSTSC